jgi:glycosyltransferase involved in cell wall biosynthesis
MPTVSVILRSYNNSRFLSEAMESALCQSYGDIEIIAIDDFSTDNSRDIIYEYERMDKRIKGVYHKKNEGYVRGLNHGIALSTGDYVTFLDGDDIWELNKLEIQLACFERHPEHGIVYSDSLVIDEEGKPTGRRFSDDYPKNMKVFGDISKSLCFRNFIHLSTVILRKECVDYAGLFEDDLGVVADWIYWLKLSRKYSFFFVSDVLARYRVHRGSSILVNTREFAVRRINGCNSVLSKFPEIQRLIKSELFYSIAMEYRWLKDKDQARKYFVKAIMANPMDLRSYFRLLFR